MFNTRIVLTRSRYVVPTFAQNGSLRRMLHASANSRVQVGDAIPDIELVEKSPGNKVSLAKELAAGKGVIVGVPAAFSE